jgi:hypothetical protein
LLFFASFRSDVEENVDEVSVADWFSVVVELVEWEDLSDEDEEEKKGIFDFPARLQMESLVMIGD